MPKLTVDSSCQKDECQSDISYSDDTKETRKFIISPAAVDFLMLANVTQESEDQCANLSVTHSKQKNKEMEENLEKAKHQIKSLKAEIESLKSEIENVKESKNDELELYKMKINEMCEEMQRYKEETTSMKKIIEEQKALLLCRHLNDQKNNKRKNSESVQTQTNFEQCIQGTKETSSICVSGDNGPTMEWETCSSNSMVNTEEKLELSYGANTNASKPTSIISNKTTGLALPTPAARNAEHLSQMQQVNPQNFMFSKPYHSTPGSLVNSYLIPKKPTPRLKLPLASTTEQKRFMNLNFIAVPRQPVPPVCRHDCPERPIYECNAKRQFSG
uniref:TBD domain-containing protein n=1 Tax=Syphacia muris TaxID=451379 RepID=A0A0N5AXE4_9BILA